MTKSKPPRNSVWRSRSDPNKIVAVRLTDERTMTVSFFRYDPKEGRKLESPRVLGIGPFVTMYDPAPEFPNYVTDSGRPYPMMGTKRRRPWNAPKPLPGAHSVPLYNASTREPIDVVVPPLRMRWELLRAAIAHFVPEALEGDEIAAYSLLRPGDPALLAYAVKCMGVMPSFEWNRAQKAKARLAELLEPAR